MKKYLLTAWAVMAAFLAGAQAEPRPNIHPALWVVKDADTTIYLFGTFHLLDGKSDWFNDGVKTAFEASQELYLEVIMPENSAELQPMIMKYAVDRTGQGLASHLPAETQTKLDKMLIENGLPKGAFEPLKPWAVEMTLASIAAMKVGANTEKGAEKVLTTAAKERGIKVGELENMEFQINLLDTLPEADQVAQLVESIDKFDSVEKEFGTMLTAWSNGDIEGLVRILNEGLADKPATYKAMFSDRNAQWTEWIKSRMDKPGTVFVAVGAGHLAGKDSVLELLGAKGIKATRVE